MPGSDEQSAASGDRRALVRLAGGNVGYEAIEFELNSLATGPDPMLAVSRSTWRLVNPHEAWLLLAGHLVTADAVRQFLLVAVEVLGEQDPLGDMTADEHFEAQLRGVGRRYSRALRRGVARTLALLCTHGGGVSLMGGRDAADLARCCVGELFATAGDSDTSIAASVRRLAELGEVLPLLAEAAPDEFVSVVERTLQPVSEAARLWFADSWDDLSVAGASSPHTPLLFSLEMLAWLPDHLADVADILLRLEVLDPDGRLANRPAETFSAIFSSWAPQTGVSHQQRLEVLESLHDRLRACDTDDGRIAALVRLLATLMPHSGSIVMSRTPPQIRDYRPAPERIAGQVAYAYEEDVRELLVGLTEHRVRERRDPDGMLEVLETAGGVTTATSLPPASRNRLWTLFEEAASTFAPEELAVVGQRLEGLVRLHRQYASAGWALPADEADRVARIAEQIAAGHDIPDDPVERHLWLFDKYHPDLDDDISRFEDLAAYEQKLLARRTAAVSDVVAADGLGSVYRLAERAEASSRGAPVGVIGEALETLESRPQDDTDASEQCPMVGDLELRQLAALKLPFDGASRSESAQREAAIARGYFSARFRRIRRDIGDGWGWLSRLLHREGLTATQQARLIELTRDHPRAWQQAEALGAAPLRQYWKLMTWHGLGHDFDHLEDVALGLLSVGRTADAVELLATYTDAATLNRQRRTELATHALEALASNDAAQIRGTLHDRWHITQLLDLLAQHHPLTQDNLDDPHLQRLTQLEIDYAQLRNLDEPAPLIHNRMSLDPHTFVEVVQVAHLGSKDHPSELDSDESTSPEPTPQWRMARSNARRILRKWQRPPGTDDADALDQQQMRAWIAEAQRLLDKLGLRDIGDRHIGRILSAAAADPTDGIAPPIAVRDLLEEGQSQHLEDGLSSGLLYGPTHNRGGFVSELVAKSRQAQQQTASNATTIARRWPRTARLLRQVASDHGQEARSWDEDPDPLD